MEDIIIILEWMKKICEMKAWGKKSKEWRKMNQMNEQLFISKELFLRLNKMLAVIRLSTNFQVSHSKLRHFLAPFQLLEPFFSLSESIKTEQLPGY